MLKTFPILHRSQIFSGFRWPKWGILRCLIAWHCHLKVYWAIDDLLTPSGQKVYDHSVVPSLFNNTAGVGPRWSPHLVSDMAILLNEHVCGCSSACDMQTAFLLLNPPLLLLSKSRWQFQKICRGFSVRATPERVVLSSPLRSAHGPWQMDLSYSRGSTTHPDIVPPKYRQQINGSPFSLSLFAPMSS